MPEEINETQTPKLKKPGVFFREKSMSHEDQPVIIKSEIRAELNPKLARRLTGRVSSLKGMVDGPVYDKDRTVEDLSQLPRLYKEAGITGKEAGPTINKLEAEFLGGTLRDQVHAAEKIAQVREGLSRVSKLRRP